MDASTPEQRYVAQLPKAKRIRLTLTAVFGDRQVGTVEWMDSSNNTLHGAQDAQWNGTESVDRLHGPGCCSSGGNSGCTTG